MISVFLHGLESSSKGNKARWFNKHFPGVVIPDFEGTLDDRMDKLRTVLNDCDDILIIGSSFGGLMATIYAQECERQVRKIILLAPALNFPEFSTYPVRMISVPTYLFIGCHDTVCPPDIVIPSAQDIFADLSVHVSEDDHHLRDTFSDIDWVGLFKS